MPSRLMQKLKIIVIPQYSFLAIQYCSQLKKCIKIHLEWHVLRERIIMVCVFLFVFKAQIYVEIRQTYGRKPVTVG